MEITFLGTGTSQGIPMIGCKCPVCTSLDPKDKRTRCSILVKTEFTTLLFDTPPDLRMQMLREGIDHVDHVLFTHQHADHMMGFDDLRRFCEISGKKMPIYGSHEVLGHLKKIFPYVFDPAIQVRGYLQAEPHAIEGPFILDSIQIVPLIVPHATVLTMGFLLIQNHIRKLVYMPDCASVPDEVIEKMHGVEILIIDGLRDKPHPTHLTVAQAIEVSQHVKAKHTYLTHQADDKRHAEREAELPENIHLAYDGLKIQI